MILRPNPVAECRSPRRPPRSITRDVAMAKATDLSRVLSGLVIVGKEILRVSAPHGAQSAVPPALRAVGVAAAAAASSAAQRGGGAGVSAMHEHAESLLDHHQRDGDEAPYAYRGKPHNNDGDVDGGRGQPAATAAPELDPSANVWRTEPGAMRSVPSSPFARITELGALAAGVAFGATSYSVTSSDFNPFLYKKQR